MNPEALEKGTHPRNHQGGGLPWARYSVDELNQQAKAGDRPYPRDLRSIFWAAPHDPDEDFHWTRQISSWTLPGLLGMFGHSFTLRQLWGVWESLPLLQGPRQRGPRNKAQNHAAPGPGRGGLQGADDPAGGMRRAHLGPGGEPPAVPRGVQGPHGPHWRPGGPGGGEGQLALQHEAVVGRRSPRLSGPLHLPQARLHQRHDQADGPGPLRPWVEARATRGLFTPPSRRTTSTAWWVRTTGRRTIRWR